MSNVEHTSDNGIGCGHRAWCDAPKGHTGAHTGEADLPKVTATGNRNDMRTHENGNGIVVPEVFAELVEQTEPTNVFSTWGGSVGVIIDDDHHATARLTLDEADLLRRHLEQLLQEAQADRAAGLA